MFFLDPKDIHSMGYQLSALADCMVARGHPIQKVCDVDVTSTPKGKGNKGTAAQRCLRLLGDLGKAVGRALMRKAKNAETKCFLFGYSYPKHKDRRAAMRVQDAANEKTILA